MTDLTPDDVRRWDAAAVLKVFQVATNRATTLGLFGEDLGQTGQLLADWQGEAGSAFHSSLGRLRTDIDKDGHESTQVAAAVSMASADVQSCKAMMSQVDETAETLGFTITADWKVSVGETAALLLGPQEAELQRQILQADLDTVKVKAHTTDHELATAMRAAVGDGGLGSDGGAGVYSSPGKQSGEQPTKNGQVQGAGADGGAAQLPSTSTPAADGRAGEGPGLTVTKGDVAIGAAGAVAGGTAEGVRQTTLRLINESPGTGPGKADPGLLKWFEDPKIGGIELKGFSRVGGVVAAASAVPAVMSDIHDGDSVAEAVTREGAGVAAGLWAGAETGALIGSAFPGAGTAVGLVAGAVIGAGASLLASKGVEAAWHPVADAVGSAVHGVESIFGFG
ncbi:hypothetical protein [Mycobacterium xenopi]|uniref:Uncharacterized protein n=1 Tax=Mycobacterium xenopi TaxID=1789 RepID=A0AAD1H2W2_MYCXE|nr:hypothetical protein [Mycobacterium xenopi]MDA3639436.1 hypothetical protein [Mycobacterium xenopi]MDA3658286.1 hypothetical protein [Mycobacterium xenopi]MDA3662041.1 hypothetical protein [Mycobacterium xenopi]SPX89055.1 Uncharacterised protein [Mycobacterium xenopi]BBU23411.1 hypothetical protein MYXE_32010 [Mycobacterium xenopi]